MNDLDAYSWVLGFGPGFLAGVGFVLSLRYRALKRARNQKAAKKTA